MQSESGDNDKTGGSTPETTTYTFDMDQVQSINISAPDAETDGVRVPKPPPRIEIVVKPKDPPTG